MCSKRSFTFSVRHMPRIMNSVKCAALRTNSPRDSAGIPVSPETNCTITLLSAPETSPGKADCTKMKTITASVRMIWSFAFEVRPFGILCPLPLLVIENVDAVSPGDPDELLGRRGVQVRHIGDRRPKAPAEEGSQGLGLQVPAQFFYVNGHIVISLLFHAKKPAFNSKKLYSN